MRPWTQRARLAWEPSLRYFDERIDIVRGFEERGLIAQFRVTAEDVAIRLVDQFHVLSFGPSHLFASVLRPDGEEDMLREAAAEVIDRLAPTRFTPPRFEIQWLVGLDQDYDSAREAASRMAFPLDTLAPIDWAMILDGRAEGAGEAHLEIGVVDSSEAPTRLARFAGNMAPDAEIPPTMWDRQTLPQVAFFCDSAWMTSETPGSAAEFLEMWDVTRMRASEVVGEVVSKLGLEIDE